MIFHSFIGGGLWFLGFEWELHFCILFKRNNSRKQYNILQSDLFVWDSNFVLSFLFSMIYSSPFSMSFSEVQLEYDIVSDSVYSLLI